MVRRINYKNIYRRAVNNWTGFHFFRDPFKNLKIIGVTGTSGKTTTATLLYRIATALGHKSGLLGTVKNVIGPESNEIPQKGPHGTPDLADLNRYFSEMVKQGCEYAFMEVTSMASDQDRYAGINFTGGIFTNLTQDHLDYHETMEKYFLAKKKFFSRLSKNAFALSNSDDARGISMIEGIKAKKYLYGFGDIKLELPNGKRTPDWRDFHGKILKSDFSGLELELGGEKVKSKLLGTFNAYNLLAVWSACKLLGFDMEKVKKIIEGVEPPKGRFDHFMSPAGVMIVIDYAHKPDALKNVLLTAREINQGNGRIISVFGCGGNRDKTKRPKMGKIGAELSDIAIFTSDNPRDENPDEIIEQMKGDLSHDEIKKVITIADRRLAIQQAVEMAKKGDVILCAGKGHEDTQEVKGIETHFSDREEFQKTFSQTKII